MNQIKQRFIENEQIVFGNKEYAYLGPELTFKNCEIILKVSTKNLTITDTKFINCQIIAKKKLVNCQEWSSAIIKGCSFKGSFVGNDFGYSDEKYGNGSIDDCNFSEADLRYCRLMSCDLKNFKLPQWPYFTVENPFKQKEVIASIEWSGKLKTWAKVLMRSQDITTGACFYAPDIANEDDTDLDEIKSMLQNINYI